MSEGEWANKDPDRARILSVLRKLVGEETYSTWCRSLEWEGSGDTTRVFAPNPFYRDWLEKSLKAPIEEALELVSGRRPKVVFQVKAPTPPATAGSTRQEIPGVGERAKSAGVPPENARPRFDARDVAGGSETATVLGDAREELPRSCSRASYAEANFTRLPFALVNDKDIRTARQILIDVTVRSGEGMQRKLWKVTPGASGMPGPFDHAVFRAIERFALDSTIRRGNPLRGPVFFHLKTLIELLGLYYNSKNIRFISNAFDRLQELSIEDVDFLRRARAGAVRKSGRGKGARGKIHLVDRIKAAGQMIRDGSSVAVAGTYAVTFGREYEDSVNARYVRPLDWDLWIDLKRPIARRLVELLDMDFYGLRNGPHVAYEYSEICQLLPCKVQRFLSLAKNVLDPAHEELTNFGYLSYEWDSGSKNRWRILYKPGPRWYAFQHDLGHGMAVTQEAKDLAAELGEPKRARFYQQILGRVDAAYVNEALQDLRAAVREGRPPENKAAWFLGALKAILAEKGLSLFPAS